MWIDQCSDYLNSGKTACKGCWAFDAGEDYEDVAVLEYNQFLDEAAQEYYEMIQEYSDGN